MIDAEIERLGRQMRALSQSPRSDPVLKALTHLIWQQINELRKQPKDADLYKMMLRMLREVHNAIAQRLRTEKLHSLR